MSAARPGPGNRTRRRVHRHLLEPRSLRRSRRQDGVPDRGRRGGEQKGDELSKKYHGRTAQERQDRQALTSAILRKADPRPLAVSIGDPSGIGPEIALAAWRLRKELALPRFLSACRSGPGRLARARRLDWNVPLAKRSPADAGGVFDARLPVVPLRASFIDTPGHPDAANAAGIIEAIDRAVADVFSGAAAAIVTCPIAKKPLYDAGFGFPGHTEYLAHLAGQSDRQARHRRS